MTSVTVTWWETETVTTRYISDIEVPDEFCAWDHERQSEYLDEIKSESSPRSASTIDGEVIETAIEEWILASEEGLTE